MAALGDIPILAGSPRPDVATGCADRYEILAEVGRGATGVVFQAYDTALGRVVAFKTLHAAPELSEAERAELRTRIRHEATAAGRLAHPGIVSVYDVVEARGAPAIVMEYVDGRSLAEVIAAEAPLSPDRAIDLVLQLSDALTCAHAQGVVHRDIKPGNILVSARGAAKLSDFGIARLPGRDATRTGTLVGSPGYMSPEQIRGERPDGRSDLFSLGVVLYEALTGANPFRGDDLATVVYRVVHSQPLPVSRLNPAVPRTVDVVLRRALEKNPDRRYPTAAAFAEALTDALARSRAALGWVERAGRLLAAVVPSRPALLVATFALVAVGGWVLTPGMALHPAEIRGERPSGLTATPPEARVASVPGDETPPAPAAPPSVPDGQETVARSTRPRPEPPRAVQSGAPAPPVVDQPPGPLPGRLQDPADRPPTPVAPVPSDPGGPGPGATVARPGADRGEAGGTRAAAAGRDSRPALTLSAIADELHDRARDFGRGVAETARLVGRGLDQAVAETSRAIAGSRNRDLTAPGDRTSVSEPGFAAPPASDGR